jgi:molybdopterin converting factor small subunit
MAIVFFIPGALRELAGRSEVRVDGSAGTVANALALLWAECPAIRDRVITERGDVRPHVNIFVDGENVRFAGGMDAPVRDGAEVFLLPAVSGGAGRRDAPDGEIDERAPAVAIVRDDPDFSGKPRLPRVRDQFERSPAPRALLIVDGDAHGQKIFGDPTEGPRLLADILAFLEKR